MARKTTDVKPAADAPVKRTRLSREAKVEIGARVFEMREEGAKWDAVTAAILGPDAHPSRGIGLREAMYVFLAERGVERIDGDDVAALVAARRADVGWAALAARTGMRVADLKAKVRNADASLVDAGEAVTGGARTYGRDDRGADGYGAERAEAARKVIVRRAKVNADAAARRAAAVKPARKPRGRKAA